MTSPSDGNRQVWDENGVMLTEWLTPTQAGETMARVRRPGTPYHRRSILKMCKSGTLACYITPHGRLIHVDDLIAYMSERYPEQWQAFLEREAKNHE
jgi:hypothetical protein